MHSAKDPLRSPHHRTVRSAALSDATEACDVVRASISECCADDHGEDAEILRRWLSNKHPDFFRSIIGSSNAFSVVAEEHGQLVGFASATNEGTVTLCYVKKSVLFTGVGKSLLQELERMALGRGITTLRLESTRTARDFYRRNGFELSGDGTSGFGVTSQPMLKHISNPSMPA